ncbi:hypothetical protein J6590_050651 [Homalodisca vitripennis]|nr:hypothetical protein J6590_050651 [Homalodisca vitripennis]
MKPAVRDETMAVGVAWAGQRSNRHQTLARPRTARDTGQTQPQIRRPCPVGRAPVEQIDKP